VQKRIYKNEKQYILRLKNGAAPIGLLAGKVLDKVEGVFALDTEQLTGECVAGTSVFHDNVLIFIDSAAVLDKAENDRTAKSKRKVTLS
jgi:hypothetical protein